ncbi:hypothetical protein NDU88_004595 [Pleurodeles waltl]|uniref:Uncharacterized protein n=1 Tax=Pleurodeles waltl TaxID=8319 RepID=A0AAV7M8T1_PLEWA|nr:hypothetical protein NDU88_004595 [Pleurodeles waltl]
MGARLEQQRAVLTGVGGMDSWALQVLQLLQEAGRLDLLAPGVAGRARPARRAASREEVAVATCSPPRGTRFMAQQVSLGS